MITNTLIKELDSKSGKVEVWERRQSEFDVSEFSVFVGNEYAPRKIGTEVEVMKLAKFIATR